MKDKRKIFRDVIESILLAIFVFIAISGIIILLQQAFSK